MTDSLFSTSPSPARIRIDGNALVSNWRALAAASGDAQTGAAVKANGYGVGARDVVKLLRKAGCQDYFVAHWREAAAICDCVPPAQISVLNGVTNADMEFALNLGATPVLNSPDQVMRWKNAGGGRCHIMLDSGINRLGIAPDQISASLFDGLDIDIAMTHLASADEDVPQNAAQLAVYGTMLQHVDCTRRSMANSAGIMLGRDYHFDLTRPGLSIYGGIARPEMTDMIQQVIYPQAQVLQIRQLSAAMPIGYNATHIIKQQTRVATLSLGYADGYFRGFSSKGRCHFDGSILPVIGRVSMDLITVDAGNCPTIKEGDWVDIDFDLRCAASVSGMSQYELLTGLGERYDRCLTLE